MDVLITFVDLVALVLLVMVTVRMIRRTQGREHRLIKVGAILILVSIPIYFGMMYFGPFQGTQIAELGGSIGSIILYYGMWLFLSKIRTLKDTESNQPPQTTATSGRF